MADKQSLPATAFMRYSNIWNPNITAEQVVNGVPELTGWVLTVMDLQIDQLQANAQKASELLKAMSNEKRLMILCYLAGGEKAVGEMEKLVGLSQSALSQHLARLRRDGLVKTRRSSQTIYYSLAGGEAQAIMETLHGIYCCAPIVKTA